jgi:hypothetical protein
VDVLGLLMYPLVAGRLFCASTSERIGLREGTTDAGSIGSVMAVRFDLSAPSNKIRLHLGIQTTKGSVYCSLQTARQPMSCRSVMMVAL